MSAPLLWVLFPGMVAGVLYVIRRWERVIVLTGVLVALGLAWLAWRLPIGETIHLAPLPGLSSFMIQDRLNLLRRSFILGNSARPFLIFVYLGVAFWFGGAKAAHTNRLFIPLGLGMSALLTAALAVEPFLYAALLIEVAALVGIPLLSPPGRPAGRGVLRFLTFQTLGMPFILFTGWLLGGVEASSGDSVLTVHATIFMALGFSFFMAIFPFHTWIPMLAEETHPYAAAFVIFMLPVAVSLFGLEFLERYTWIRELPVVTLSLRFVGTLMVVTSGVWAAFQRNLGRMLGYAALMEIGLSLLALSLGIGPASAAAGGTPLLGIFFALLLPRGLGLALWALALAILKNKSSQMNFRSLQGMAHCLPLASASLVLAQLSLAGLPLLAGFPAHVALWSALAQQSLTYAGLTLLGNAGLLAGGIQTLVVLVIGPPDVPWQVTETWPQRLMLALGALAIFSIGLFPQWFLPSLINLAQVIVTTPP